MYPLSVSLLMRHNHALIAGDVLRHRDVGPVAEAAIVKLLHNSYSPSAALYTYKYDLQEEHPADYAVYAGDRFHCPDQQWCYRFRQQILRNSKCIFRVVLMYFLIKMYVFSILLVVRMCYLNTIFHQIHSLKCEKLN